jgi:glycosyltransferase involved in cell wall biosynthesis
MYIAAVSRPDDPSSLRVYATNMAREVGALGAEVVLFAESDPIPASCDLVWDPGLCMRRVPAILAASRIPVVGTIHGFKAFSLPPEEIAFGDEDARCLLELKAALAEDWRWLRAKASAIVAVSNYAAAEAQAAFDLDPALVHVVYNGVDREIFSPRGVHQPGRYFLAVSSSNPIKNLARVLDAYAMLPREERQALVVVAPGFSESVAIEGVRLIGHEVVQEELAHWYRGAIALVFPSLRETFGLPIVEAMACGCPVITSQDTACAEVAGGAALLVDPRSAVAIADAMRRISDDAALQQDLSARGIDRSRSFSWRASAKRVVEIFQSVIPARRKKSPRIRKIEVTTTSTCAVACHFCPQKAFGVGYRRRGGSRQMSWDTYTSCLMKLPANVGVSFGGMTEPFQNSQCTDMILYAKRRGHSLEIFSTLVGLSRADLERLLAELSIGRGPADDRFYVHLPSADNIERIDVTDEYRGMVHRLVEFSPEVEFHYHGSRLDRDLADIDFAGRVNYWAIHDRAENETRFCKKAPRKSGKLACIMNVEVNVLLPNGDVLACSQDFGANHVIGNLLRGDPAALYRSDEFLRIRSGLADESQEVMCRYCHFAVQDDLADDAISS